ncbi:hypothetical protein K3495_g13650, partial [Podosphaera aphanis]
QWQTWLKELGIQFQPSVPYKHSQNGVAERAIATIFNISRSMVYHANIQWKKFWCIAVEHANYIRNRTPTTALPFGPEGSLTSKSCTPIMAYTTDKVHLENLKIFGCAAFPKRLHKLDGPSKLEPKIQGEEDYLFIGMQGNSIFKLTHRKTLKMMVSADCKFSEYLFKGLELNKSNPRSETTNDGLPSLANSNKTQSNKRKFNEIKNTFNERNMQKYQCNPSTEATYTPRAHQQDALTRLGGNNQKPLVVTRFGRTVKPKVLYAENTKPVYGHEIIKLAQSLSAVSIEAEESQNPVVDTFTPLFENIDVSDEIRGDDAEQWEQSIREELQALKDTNTFKLCKSNIPLGKC